VHDFHDVELVSECIVCLRMLQPKKHAERIKEVGPWLTEAVKDRMKKRSSIFGRQDLGVIAKKIVHMLWATSAALMPSAHPPTSVTERHTHISRELSHTLSHQTALNATTRIPLLCVRPLPQEHTYCRATKVPRITRSYRSSTTCVHTCAACIVCPSSPTFCFDWRNHSRAALFSPTY
jgi:hypothetical protein